MRTVSGNNKVKNSVPKYVVSLILVITVRRVFENMAQIKTSISTIKLHEKLVELLNIGTGNSVLDLGCGHGTSLQFLLKKVGNKGKVTGIDNRNAVLAIAAKRYANAIDTGQLVLKKDDFSKQIPFETAQFDRVICQNVIECIPNKIHFLNECYRILKSNGYLLVSHHDFDSVVINSTYKDLTRKLVHFYSDFQQDWQETSDAQIGRKLHGLFSESAFEDFSAGTLVIDEYHFQEGYYGYQYISSLFEMAKKQPQFEQEKLNNWLNDFKCLEKKSAYYFSINLMYVLAKRQSNE